MKTEGMYPIVRRVQPKTMTYDGQGCLMFGTPGQRELVAALKPEHQHLAPLIVGAIDLLYQVAGNQEDRCDQADWMRLKATAMSVVQEAFAPK